MLNDLLREEKKISAVKQYCLDVLQSNELIFGNLWIDEAKKINDIAPNTIWTDPEKMQTPLSGLIRSLLRGDNVNKPPLHATCYIR